MSNVAIRVEGLGKKYRLGTTVGRTPYKTLRESMVDLLSRPVWRGWARARSRGGSDRPEFWAVQDVSFEVRRGEVLGIVGRNGAGKSTLLKMLSRITEPTKGRIGVNGRVASLLEVGTGFHPELTGRENIFLNGAILGMAKVDIERRFDQIVAFAEVEPFIDTQVKRYSSGMYLRLAFAVAAHLEPEILIVDEVLAVGDAQFQKKCLGQMEELAGEGRTVLLVSHNMAAVLNLAQRALWLEAGRSRQIGPAAHVVQEYLAAGASHSGEQVWSGGICNPGVQEFLLHAVRIRDSSGRISALLASTEPFQIDIEYEILQTLPYCRVGLVLRAAAGPELMEVYDVDSGEYDGVPRPPGRYSSSCTIPGHLLNGGSYSLSINAGIVNIKNMVQLDNVLRFEVEETRVTSTIAGIRRRGYLRPKLDWRITRDTA